MWSVNTSRGKAGDSKELKSFESLLRTSDQPTYFSDVSNVPTLPFPMKEACWVKGCWGKVSPVGKPSRSLTAGMLKPLLHWTEVWTKFPILHSTRTHPRHPLLFTYKASGILAPGFWKRDSKCYTMDNGHKRLSDGSGSLYKSDPHKGYLPTIGVPKNVGVSNFLLLASKPLDIFLLGGAKRQENSPAVKKIGIISFSLPSWAGIPLAFVRGWVQGPVSQSGLLWF